MSAETYVQDGLMLHWERADPVHVIGYAYDKKALVALEEYFGPFPITIKRDDLRMLRAMMTAGGGRPLDVIIGAVEREGSIRIWWDSQKVPDRAMFALPVRTA